MIVDCHTQIWDQNARLGSNTPSIVRPADANRHLEAADPVDRAIVLAFKSRYLDAEIPNRFVADYVRRYSPKMLGFAGIDPTERDWREELRIAQEDLQLKGVVVSPAMQDFHPSDTLAMRLYEECARRGMPIVFDQQHRAPAAKMEYARPLLLDEVARSFPSLPIVISHLGYPWTAETTALLAKHERVYADIAGLHDQQWLTYTALLTAYEYGVMDKLLFASGFPQRAPAECIEALYSINQLAHGTNLKAVPREQLRGIVERDALRLLGLENTSPTVARNKTGIFSNDD
ncbi:MAG: amidohydrolase family protein [Phycisphaerae bacterium]|jgi:predicted TIM-barrel fold metal-dependent hydrolase